LPKPNKTVDARGLNCPMPITKSMQAIKKIRKGQILEILTTDPGSKKDIPIWAQATKQELLSFEELGPESFRFLVKKHK
jgi:tRNA 2-thiouridine synthesizing protein A